MSSGSIFNGFVRPRAFVCLPCRILRLSRRTAQSRSLPSRSSSRSFAKTAGKDLEKSQSTITNTFNKPQPTSTPNRTTFSQKRDLKRKAARKPQSKTELKIKKVPGRQRRRAFIRRVRSTRLIEDQSIKGVFAKNESVKGGSVDNVKSRDVSHLYKTLEDLGNSIENSLSPSRNAKRGAASVLEVKHLKLDVIDVARPPVPQLAHGLSRVLFNPGVAHVRDPRSRVLNFDAHLEKLMPVRDFDFDTLNIFTPPSKDQTLAKVARDQKKKYVASTSSMTGVLKHFHFLLSKWRAINFSMLSKIFPIKLTSYTKMTRAPEAIFLKWKDGVYAVDADKMYDTANVLSLMGRYMEKLLTLEKYQFDRHRVGSNDQISHEERQEPEAFHYSTLGDIVLRSQLDAYDERLPGTGMFDLKTRAVIPIRMDSSDFEWGMDYEIRSLHGEWQSFEREYHDMIRSTMLKYSLQVRMGRMDGIFVAFHNIARIFGFQYVSLDEMDDALHGQSDRTLGDQEFVGSVKLMNDVFDMATEKFPKQNIRFHFETRETTDPFMYIFAEPVSEEVTNEIQSMNKAKIKEWEESLLSPKLNDEVSEVLSKHDGDLSVANKVDGPEFKNDTAETNVERLQESVNASLSGEASISSETRDLASEGASPKARTVRSTPAKTVSDASAQDNGAQDLSNFISAHATDVQRTVTSCGAQDDRQTDSKSSTDTASLSQIIGDTSTSGDSALLSALRPAVMPGGTSSPPLTNNYPPLLAFQLYVQNRVNGSPVTRPHNPLTVTDEWTIHHTFAPIESPSRAWALYNACKARRHKEMSEEARETRGEEDYFKNILRNVTEEGRVWREGLEEADREGDARRAAAREQS